MRLIRTVFALFLAIVGGWLAFGLTFARLTGKPRYGVAPWGDRFGVRLTPLSREETAAARARERAELYAAWRLQD